MRCMMTRRDFLETTGVAGTALAMDRILTA